MHIFLSMLKQFYQILIVTSNRSYLWIIDPDGWDSNPSYWNAAFSILADMESGDTAEVQGLVSPTDGATIQVGSHFSGYLAC